MFLVPFERPGCRWETRPFIDGVSPVVPAAHARVQPLAVVIEVFHTLVTNSTVFDFRAS